MLINPPCNNILLTFSYDKKETQFQNPNPNNWNHNHQSSSSKSMSPKTLSNSRHTIDTCTFQLHSWRPFHLPTTLNKTLEKTENNINHNQSSSSKPYKRRCLTDRTTSFSIETLDMSKLSLFDDDGNGSRSSVKSKRDRIHWMTKKRRRRGSRSVSGRSCSVGASNAYGTCSDFMMANNGGTDSSGELFVNGDVNWASDTSDVRNLRRDSGGDRENLNMNTSSNGYMGLHHYHGNLDNQGNESGYGSEPGYRGDAEFGYGDEFDEEDDTRLLFWGNRFGDAQNMEIIGENTLQKAHHRCRRKKHELRMVDAV